MADFEILDLDSKKKWSEYLHTLPIEQQDIYYTPEYYSLYENYDGGKALCFVFKKDAEIALYPFLLNSVNKIGYELKNEYYDIQGAYGYNGIVSSSYDEVFINKFYESFTNYCNDANIIAEFTRFHPLLKNEIFSINSMDVTFNRKTVKISLTDYTSIEDVRKMVYTKEARKNVKKARRQGIKFIIADKEGEYRDFYNIYTNRMLALNADNELFFNEPFFLSFINKQQLKCHNKLILAQLDNSIIGGIILLFNMIYAHNFLSASLALNKNLKTNDYLQDAAILLAINQKCSTFHLGGGNSSNEYDSLFRFKSKFSTETALFSIGTNIHNLKIYNDITNQWKKMYPTKQERYNNYHLKYRY